MIEKETLLEGLSQWWNVHMYIMNALCYVVEECCCMIRPCSIE